MIKIIATVTILSLVLLADGVSIKTTSLSFDYLETENGVKLDSENNDHGDFTGIELGYYKGMDSGYLFKSYIAGKIAYSRGLTQYVGSYVGSGSYGDVVATTKNTLIESSLEYGRSFLVAPDLSVGGQCGILRREWKRKLPGNTEDYQWFGWSGGLRVNYEINPTLIVSALYDYQQAIDPNMYASSTSMNYPLGGANGHKLTLRSEYQYDRFFVLQLDYVYDYWSILRSDVIQGWYEPDSKTKNNYLKIGIVHKF
jgi:hypothetical protein